MTANGELDDEELQYLDGGLPEVPHRAQKDCFCVLCTNAESFCLHEQAQPHMQRYPAVTYRTIIAWELSARVRSTGAALPISTAADSSTIFERRKGVLRY